MSSLMFKCELQPLYYSHSHEQRVSTELVYCHDIVEPLRYKHKQPLHGYRHIHTSIYTVHVYVSAVGSQLSELRLSVSKHLDVGSCRHVFGSSRKKTLLSLQFCYRRKQSCCINDFSRMLQHLFHPVRDLDHNLQCSS